MPNSLRSRLNKLVYKGLLEKDDLKRIIVLPVDATNGDIMCLLFGKDINIVDIDTKGWWESTYEKENR